MLYTLYLWGKSLGPMAVLDTMDIKLKALLLPGIEC